MRLKKVFAGMAVAGLIIGAQNVWADTLGIRDPPPFSRSGRRWRKLT